MCGIAGLLYFDADRPIDPVLLDRMTDVLSHRGPDGRGTHVDGPLGLGHRRLAIIDLSDDAAQPMCNEDGTVWVVLNGEIYNFQELRDELIGKGHTFRSKSDTEVIVHLYEEVGDALVERLRGMFALAVWDSRQRRLLLARDRFGQKPLYYRLTRDSLHFASEIKGIVEDPAVPRVPDPDSIHDYLTYGYVPAPRTGFAGIHKLRPGHLMTVEGDGRHTERQYWSLHMTPKQDVADTPQAWARVEEEVLGLIDEAVKLRMISDVPLGAFLSGGVDSSAIVASMCAAQGGRGHDVRTFSIGFDQPAWDETAHAERVARHLGTDHEALILTPDSLGGLERIMWHYGDPYADSSCLPTFAVSGLARRRVTVVLSGDGGDELFVGYRRYQGTALSSMVKESSLPVRLAARNRYLIHLLHRFGRDDIAVQLDHNRTATQLGPADLYLTRMEYTPPWMKHALYQDTFHAATRGRDARQRLCQVIAKSDGTTFVERIAHADATTYLADDILVKVDVASMAHGLECRAPLLDHVLAEYVASLPFPFKMNGLDMKVALKRAVRHRLPQQTLERRKMGFGVPLDHWFRGGISSVLQETVLSKRALERGYFRPEALRGFVDDHASGRQNYQTPLFTLLMLELWHRIFIDPPQGSQLQAPSVNATSSS